MHIERHEIEMPSKFPVKVAVAAQVRVAVAAQVWVAVAAQVGVIMMKNDEITIPFKKGQNERVYFFLGHPK